MAMNAKCTAETKIKIALFSIEMIKINDKMFFDENKYIYTEAKYNIFCDTNQRMYN